jgi:hypothetical protein
MHVLHHYRIVLYCEGRCYGHRYRQTLSGARECAEGMLERIIAAERAEIDERKETLDGQGLYWDRVQVVTREQKGMQT